MPVSTKKAHYLVPSMSLGLLLIFFVTFVDSVVGRFHTSVMNSPNLATPKIVGLPNGADSASVRRKSFVAFRIGDGDLPKSAKKRQKAPFLRPPTCTPSSGRHAPAGGVEIVDRLHGMCRGCAGPTTCCYFGRARRKVSRIPAEVFSRFGEYIGASDYWSPQQALG